MEVQEKSSTSSAFRQFVVAFLASLSSFICSVAFSWVAPLIVKLKEPGSEIPLTPDESSWVVSLIMVGAMASSLPVGLILNKIGRKPILLIVGLILISAWITVLTTRNVGALYAARVLQGLALGAMCSSLPVYLGEIAGAEIRGSIGYFFQGMWYIGNLYEYSTGPYFSYNTVTWIALAPCIVFIVTFLFVPESPYYLLLKGKKAEAEEALTWLRGKNRVSAELEQMSKSIDAELSNKGSWKDIFSSKNGRKAFGLVLLVQASYIMCGGTAMFSYATDTFSKTKTVGIGPNEITIVMGSVVLCLVPFSGFVADRFGRRVIFVTSLLGSALFLGIVSTYYYLYFETGCDLSCCYWVPHVVIISYTATIGAGIECVAPVFQAEVFPTSTRAAAGGLSWFLSALMSLLCLKLYQVIADGLGLYVLYAIFTGFAILGAILILVFVPETKDGAMVACYVLRQILVGFVSSLSSFICSVAFSWVAPLIVKLKEPGSEIPLTPDESSWVVSLIMVGSMVTTVPVGLILNKTGRKPILLLAGITLIISWVFPLTIRSVPSLYVARVLQGIAEGTVCSSLPVYLGEIAGTEIRGSIGYFFLGLWYVGNLYAYIIGAYFQYSTVIWLSMAPCILFIVTFAFVPESPHYLVLKGRTKKAEKVLTWLRGASTAVEELEQISESIKTELSSKGSCKEVFSSRNGRKAFGLVLLVQASYIMCGGTAMFSYATDTFSKTETVGVGPFEFSIFMCCVVLCLVPFSGFIADMCGRRLILVASLLGSALFSGIASTYYYLYFKTDCDLSCCYWVPHVSIISYAATVGAGIECLAPVFQAEVFPTSIRAAAGGLSWFSASFMSLIYLKLYQVIADGVGLFALYAIFAGFAIFGAILILIFVPETKGKTFDEIQTILENKK